MMTPWLRSKEYLKKGRKSYKVLRISLQKGKEDDGFDAQKLANGAHRP